MLINHLIFFLCYLYYHFPGQLELLWLVARQGEITIVGTGHTTLIFCDGIGNHLAGLMPSPGLPHCIPCSISSNWNIEAFIQQRRQDFQFISTQISRKKVLQINWNMSLKIRYFFLIKTRYISTKHIRFSEPCFVEFE